LLRLTAERIEEAERGLKEMLGVDSLAGLDFLDIGSGSGLFSLAAKNLGARVFSIDFDPDSVRCTEHLKSVYYSDDDRWTIREGSVLDDGLLRSLGKFDIVYAWGVLHHTGSLRQAMDNVCLAAKDNGKLFLMIYVDWGLKSRIWRIVKRTYVSGILGRSIVLGTFIPYYVARGLVEDLVRLKNPIDRYHKYKSRRGMSVWHDWIDWLGGYPYECAKPEDVIAFYRQHGFECVKNIGHEYVFERQRPNICG